MILQALTDYYAVLAAQGRIAQLGWNPVKVSFVICITDDGVPVRVTDIRTEQSGGKKAVLLPQSINLPAPYKRSRGIVANFLCDHSGYLLGMDDKGNPERTRECFDACRALHKTVLHGVDNPTAKAILAFFATWNPETASADPVFAALLSDIRAGGNLIFCVNGRYAHEEPDIRRAWDRYYGTTDGNEEAVCLVTGEWGAVEALHPVIKNIAGAQSGGASLVSFNAPSFCSFGKEQGLNAPTGKYAAFAYTAALNALLSARDNVICLGDVTVVIFAKDGCDMYARIMNVELMGAELSQDTAWTIGSAIRSLCRGEAAFVDDTRLDPQMACYVLGLSPNAARLSVRFFLHDTFGAFLRHCEAHRSRLEIIRPHYDRTEVLSLWQILNETVNQKAGETSPTPGMAGDVLCSVLNDTPYPATILYETSLRITAERKITRRRAAIIKAYYLRNPNPSVPREILTVALNPDSRYTPYVLGRLFAVLEHIRDVAYPGIRITLGD